MSIALVQFLHGGLPLFRRSEEGRVILVISSLEHKVHALQSTLHLTVTTLLSLCTLKSPNPLHSNEFVQETEVRFLSTGNNPKIQPVCTVESANQSSASQTIKSLEDTGKSCCASEYTSNEVLECNERLPKKNI